MARRTSDLEQFRRGLYRAQRAIGDVQAASRGPAPLARRIARRALTRDLFRMLRRIGR